MVDPFKMGCTKGTDKQPTYVYLFRVLFSQQLEYLLKKDEKHLLQVVDRFCTRIWGKQIRPVRVSIIVITNE